MTAIDPDALACEIRDRIAGQGVASVARRETRRQQRTELAQRRTAGLRQRHAAKLARRSDTSDAHTPRDDFWSSLPDEPPAGR